MTNSKPNESLRRLRKERRKQKLCVQCGGQDDRTIKGLYECQSCADKKQKKKGVYDKERYAKRKAEHLCTACGKQDERTLNGFAMCADCCQKLKAYRQRPEIRAAHNAIEATKSLQRYYNRQNNHQCVRCGIKLADDYYYVMCEACRAKAKEYSKKRKTAKRGNA